MLTALLTAERLTLRIPRTDIALPLWQWLPALVLGLMVAVLPMTLAVALPVAFIGLFVALAVVENPLWGLVAVLFLGPLGAAEETFIGGPIGSITSGQMMLFFTLGVWAMRGLKNSRIVIPWTPLNIPLLIFILMGAFSLWYAEGVMPGIREMVKWVEILLLMWLMLDLTREYKPRTVLYGTIGLLLSAGLVQGLYGTYQFAIAGSGPWHFAIGGRLFRAVGTFMQPNPYGGYMALNAFLAVGLLVGVVSAEFQDKPLTPQSALDFFRFSRFAQLAGVVAGIMILGVIGSWSRGAWINFALGMGVVTLLAPQKLFTGVKLVVGAVVAFWSALQIGLVPAAFADRLFGFVAQFSDAENLALTPSTFSLLERLAHWQAGLDMAADSLWLGQGFGNYEVVYEDFQDNPMWSEALGHAHNYYINIMAEMGMFGLLAYLFMWGSVFWVTIRVIRRSAPLERGVAIGMLGAWVGLAIHHMLDNMYVKNIYLHIGVMFALLVMLDLRASADSVWNKGRRKRTLPLSKRGFMAKLDTRLEKYVGN